MVQRGSSKVLFIDLQCLVLFLFKISGNLHHIKCYKGISQSLLYFVFHGVSFELFFDRKKNYMMKLFITYDIVVTTRECNLYIPRIIFNLKY